MSDKYPGLPEVTRLYWKHLSRAAVAAAIPFIFTGSFAALILSTFEPRGLPYFWLAIAALIVHVAAFMLRDVWSGEYDPNQTEFTSWTQLVVLYIVLAIHLSTVLLIGSLGGLGISGIVQNTQIAGWAFAAYYPVMDLIWMRRGHWTPGGVALIGSAVVAGMVFNLHQSLVDSLPIIGNNRRPQL